MFGNDWYCFYQYKDFGGRRLQWNLVHTDPVYFSEYDFVNRTSSWSNKGGLTVKVYGRTSSGSDASCRPGNGNWLWNMLPHSSSSSVHSSLDNRADCFVANRN
ncbi:MULTISPECIES: peptidase inhibitor family I36 protein [Streptomyces]|uniref:peptidase inhibitor family I36 protein n=1 Tax=Streptomyces TaxID=1883 RepID=UPI0022492BCD|nr:peptidase inhibitor family I36 protein [Streptomyces sp. JHD 1]MCX2971942.1 peptidase inhibitor family I36 protein [Streptomyces sp. JHD 1]